MVRKTLNQSGQMVVEMLLLMTVLFGVTFAISAYFKNDEVFPSSFRAHGKTSLA